MDNKIRSELLVFAVVEFALRVLLLVIVIAVMEYFLTQYLEDVFIDPPEPVDHIYSSREGAVQASISTGERVGDQIALVCRILAIGWTFWAVRRRYQRWDEHYKDQNDTEDKMQA